MCCPRPASSGATRRSRAPSARRPERYNAEPPDRATRSRRAAGERDISLHRFHTVQQLPIGLDEAWGFFSDPANLAVITPPEMAFAVTHELPARMHPGLIVKYRVRPLLGVPVTWVTEITHVVEGQLFVDEQRLGPYRFWHHQHHFREVPGGVEMRDIVHYDVGFGPLGDVVNLLVVRRRLRAIFEFRRRVLDQRFGTLAASSSGHE